MNDMIIILLITVPPAITILVTIQTLIVIVAGMTMMTKLCRENMDGHGHEYDVDVGSSNSQHSWINFCAAKRAWLARWRWRRWHAILFRNECITQISFPLRLTFYECLAHRKGNYLQGLNMEWNEMKWQNILCKDLVDHHILHFCCCSLHSSIYKYFIPSQFYYSSPTS